MPSERHDSFRFGALVIKMDGDMCETRISPCLSNVAIYQLLDYSLGLGPPFWSYVLVRQGSETISL